MKVRYNKAKRAFVIELPDINGKAQLEQFGEGVANQTLETSSGIDEYIQAKRTLAVLEGYVNGLQEAAEQELDKYVGETIHGVKVERGGGVSVRYKYETPEYKLLAKYKKDLEEIMKKLYKAQEAAKMENKEFDGVEVVVNPFTGEMETYGPDSAAQAYITPRSEYRLTI